MLFGSGFIVWAWLSGRRRIAPIYIAAGFAWIWGAGCRSISHWNHDRGAEADPRRRHVLAGAGILRRHVRTHRPTCAIFVARAIDGLVYAAVAAGDSRAVRVGRRVAALPIEVAFQISCIVGRGSSSIRRSVTGIRYWTGRCRASCCWRARIDKARCDPRPDGASRAADRRGGFRGDGVDAVWQAIARRACDHMPPRSGSRVTHPLRYSSMAGAAVFAGSRADRPGFDGRCCSIPLMSDPCSAPRCQTRRVMLFDGSRRAAGHPGQRTRRYGADYSGRGGEAGAGAGQSAPSRAIAMRDARSPAWPSSPDRDGDDCRRSPLSAQPIDLVPATGPIPRCREAISASLLAAPRVCRGRTRRRCDAAGLERLAPPRTSPCCAWRSRRRAIWRTRPRPPT